LLKVIASYGVLVSLQTIELIDNRLWDHFAVRDVVLISSAQYFFSVTQSNWETLLKELKYGEIH
jgi:hypothetical protein